MFKISKAEKQLTTQDIFLDRTTLIREVYRSLINTGRSYAAFTKKEQKLVEALRDREEILDPNSGYGLLTRYCAEAGVKSYCVEFNLPQHLWQLLCYPAHASKFIRSIQMLLAWRSQWPQLTVRGLASDDWFPPESQILLQQLLRLTRKAVKKCFGTNDETESVALALLLPFVGRLSCSVPGDISTHTKMGGICVYYGWEHDYEVYLQAIQHRLRKILQNSLTTTHSILHADARTFKFPKNRFAAMITSPPYPNHRDFISMFAPEHAYLAIVGAIGILNSNKSVSHIIGSNFVSNRPARLPETQSAKRFLQAIKKLKRDSNAIYDDEVYYIPYFENYFADLEAMYRNVSLSLKDKFEGYIIVVDNTHRNLIVPVSNVVREIWKGLGFKTSLFDSKELFHIGTKNPRARGLRAKHMEHVIKIWR